MPTIPYNPRRYTSYAELEYIEEYNLFAELNDKQKHTMGADPVAMLDSNTKQYKEESKS